MTLAAPISNASPTCNMVRIVTETANETEKQRARLRGCRCLGERIGHVTGHCHNRGSARVRLARPVAAPTASVTQPTHSRPRDDAVCSAMCCVRPSDTQFSSSPRWARSPSGCGARSKGSTMRMTVRYTAELQRYRRSAGVSAGRRAVRHRRGFHHDRSLQRADTRRRQVLLDAGGSSASARDTRGCLRPGRRQSRRLGQLNGHGGTKPHIHSRVYSAAKDPATGSREQQGMRTTVTDIQLADSTGARNTSRRR